MKFAIRRPRCGISALHSYVRHRIVIGAGTRRVEVTEEHQLYSSSTVYFRQEAGVHPSRRALSLGPVLSRTTTEEDDGSSDFDVDREDNEVLHARRTRDTVRSRRASVDLHNFHRDVVSHHATTHIPSPAYIPTTEGTPEESPASSAANLSATQHTLPSDQGSPSRPHSLSHVQSNSFPVQHNRPTTSGTSDDPDPVVSSVAQMRAIQAPGDFRRALGSDLNATPVRPTPPQIDTSLLASPTLSPPLYTPLDETPSRSSPSRSPGGLDDVTHGRRRSKSRFSLSAISDAILDSVRSRSPLAAKKRAEGTPIKSDAHCGEKHGESTRGRSREKGKGKNRDLSYAFIKVSEVLGLEPEEGKDSREGWKEFKKGVLVLNILPGHPVPHAFPGTYTYPISFAIPADSPPSLDCIYGSITWSMKATVHRPGKFIPRMEAVRTINVVATPSEDATEDVESVTVNKTWEDQMVYYLSVVGRAFPIGSKIPIQLTLMPLAKIKIQRVSVVIDGMSQFVSKTSILTGSLAFFQ